MINLKIDDAARVLVVEMKGMISESDIDGAIVALQARYPAVGVHLRGGERGGFSMLVDWQDLEGWITDQVQHEVLEEGFSGCFEAE